MKYVAGLCLGFALGLIFVNLILGEHSQQYKKGFEAGIKHEKQKRTAWADSIRSNNKWDNGIPDSVRKDFKWE